MSVLLFAMLDGSTLPLARSFVEEHLANGVFPRLLGFAMPDGLTTPQPSTDERKRLTILCELGVEKRDFLELLQLLRTRDVLPTALVGARTAALLIGGLEAVDNYVWEPCAPPEQPAPYHPMCPREDTQNRFQWTVSLDGRLAENELSNSGWSVTGRSEDPFRYYMRKPVDI